MLRQFIILTAFTLFILYYSNIYSCHGLYWSQKVPDNSDSIEFGHLDKQQPTVQVSLLDVSSITYSMPFDDGFWTTKIYLKASKEYLRQSVLPFPFVV